MESSVSPFDSHQKQSILTKQLNIDILTLGRGNLLNVIEIDDISYG